MLLYTQKIFKVLNGFIPEIYAGIKFDNISEVAND